MPDFGPRLPPLAPERLDRDQRAFHDEAVALIDRQFPGVFETRTADDALIGPWSVWIRDPEVGRAAQALTGAIARLDALPRRAHEIVILTLGARFDAAYELYAHCAVARRVGLDDPQIAALCAGNRPEGLSGEDAIAFDCASALARGGALPGFLYAAAEAAFGAKGLAQLTYLAGAYAFVSILLNAHDVPAPKTNDRA